MESFQFLLQMLKDQETMDKHYITQEVDGVEDKVSGNTIGIKTLVDAFLKMSLRSPCFIDEAFFLKVKSVADYMQIISFAAT
jgi:hypothetical protein